MIKAKKSLLITLFAAMMIFAFGATSVFAMTGTPKADWGDYSKVTISGCTGSDAVYNRDESIQRVEDIKISAGSDEGPGHTVSE